MKQLTRVALAQEIKENPYAKYLTASLAERCAQVQADCATGHWASMRNELEIARTTLCDSLQFYAATTAIPSDNPKRLEVILSAGKMVRDVIAEITALARQAVAIEVELKDRHDPQVTLQFIQQTVRVLDERLRLAEEEGYVKDAEKIIEAITQDVSENVRLPFDSPLSLNGSVKPVGISPSTTLDVVKSMIDTVPAA